MNDHMATTARAALPLATVIIPARNCVHLIDQQLRALNKQTYPGEFSVIVSDNGSTDGLRRHIEAHPLAAALSLGYIDASDARGAAYARNVGAVHANGEFLAFCDADDVVMPSWLERLVEFAVGSGLDIVGTTGELTTLNDPDHIRSMTMPGERGWSWKPFVCGGSFGAWADVYRDLGGMNPEFITGEDNEFSFRAQDIGYRLDILSEPLFACRVRRSIRDSWSRGFEIGQGEGKLALEFRRSGYPEIRLSKLLLAFLFLAQRNPVIPKYVTNLSNQEWAGFLGHTIGMTYGAVKYGVLSVR